MHDARPLINFAGQQVALGPLGVEHAAAIAGWYADYGTMRTWALLPGPRSVAQIRQAFDPGGFFADPTTAAFAVYAVAREDLVGFAGLFHVDHINRTAEFFVLIGEARNRGRGYGTEATRLVLDHAFLGLGLANVVLRVYAYNLAGLRAYEKAGFRRAGVRHQSKLMGGRLWDTIFMEVLAEEFTSPVLREVLVPDQARDDLTGNANVRPAR